MTVEPVELDALLAVWQRLVDELRYSLDADERNFLLSLARADPDWSLLGIEHLHELPAIRWKLLNLRQLATTDRGKLNAQALALERILNSV